MIRIPSHWKSLAPLPLRLALGLALAVAGSFKLFSGAGHENIVLELENLGLPLPGILSWVVGAAELLCGLGLLLGAYTQLSALVMILNIGGLLVICLLQGIWYPESEGLPGLRYFPYRLPSLEASAVFLAGLFSVLLSGPGAWSASRNARGGREDRSGG